MRDAHSLCMLAPPSPYAEAFSHVPSPFPLSPIHIIWIGHSQDRFLYEPIAFCCRSVIVICQSWARNTTEVYGFYVSNSDKNLGFPKLRAYWTYSSILDMHQPPRLSYENAGTEFEHKKAGSLHLCWYHGPIKNS